MESFQVGDGGRLRELGSRALTEWLVANVPGSDALAQEAHIALLRAYGEVTSRQKQDGLAKGYFRVLLQLRRAEGQRLPLSRLSRTLRMTQGNLTRLINAMEQEGWIERLADQTDRRMTWALLTTAGAERFDQALPTVLQQIEDVWQGVTPEEMRLLTHLLNRLWLSALSANAALPTATEPSTEQSVTVPSA